MSPSTKSFITPVRVAFRCSRCRLQFCRRMTPEKCSPNRFVAAISSAISRCDSVDHVSLSKYKSTRQQSECSGSFFSATTGLSSSTSSSSADRTLLDCIDRIDCIDSTLLSVA